MKKRSFRSSFVSVILVITIAIFTVNLVVYGINIKEIRQAEVFENEDRWGADRRYDYYIFK